MIIKTVTGDFESQFEIAVQACRQTREGVSVTEYGIQVERLRARCNISVSLEGGRVSIKFDGWPEVKKVAHNPNLDLDWYNSTHNPVLCFAMNLQTTDNKVEHSHNIVSLSGTTEDREKRQHDESIRERRELAAGHHHRHGRIGSPFVFGHRRLGPSLRLAEIRTVHQSCRTDPTRPLRQHGIIFAYNWKKFEKKC